MGKKYGYYEEISQLRSLNIQIHNFYDEQPPKDEYVVVLYYTADPFDPKETWTERMWQEPFLLTRDICGGDEVEFSKEFIPVFWISSFEISQIIEKFVGVEAVRDLALAIVMRHLEEQLKNKDMEVEKDEQCNQGA